MDSLQHGRYGPEHLVVQTTNPEASQPVRIAAIYTVAVGICQACFHLDKSLMGLDQLNFQERLWELDIQVDSAD